MAKRARPVHITETGFRALAVAIMRLAVQDALNGRAEAIAWLRAEGPTWCGVLGYELQPATLERLLSQRGDRAVFHAIGSYGRTRAPAVQA